MIIKEVELDARIIDFIDVDDNFQDSTFHIGGTGYRTNTKNYDSARNTSKYVAVVENEEVNPFRVVEVYREEGDKLLGEVRIEEYMTLYDNEGEGKLSLDHELGKILIKIRKIVEESAGK